VSEAWDDAELVLELDDDALELDDDDADDWDEADDDE